MNSRRFSFWTALALISCVAGCAGNGKGLDQNGEPIGASGGNPGGAGGPVTADFESIQANVFTPICSKCHIGAGAPEGLQLDASHSYNLLVGVPSVEQPDLLRVKPSDPANSYLLHKIEGAPGIVGGQMPLGETPLPQATIDAISQWITNGAPNVPSAAATAFEVQDTVPLDHEIMTAPLPRIVVTFTADVDASLVNETTVAVERIANPRLDAQSALLAGSSKTVAVTRTLAGLNASVLLITPQEPLAPGTYRVTVRGSGGGAIADLNATPLGLDHSFEFTVEPIR